MQLQPAAKDGGWLQPSLAPPTSSVARQRLQLSHHCPALNRSCVLPIAPPRPVYRCTNATFPFAFFGRGFCQRVMVGLGEQRKGGKKRKDTIIRTWPEAMTCSDSALASP